MSPPSRLRALPSGGLGVSAVPAVPQTTRRRDDVGETTTTIPTAPSSSSSESAEQTSSPPPPRSSSSSQTPPPPPGAAQTVGGVDGKEPVNTTHRRKRTPMRWEEARNVRVIQEAEATAAGMDAGLPPLFIERPVASRAAKTFRWIHRFTEKGQSKWVAIDGDAGAVYPGCSNLELATDVGCLTRYFAAPAMARMAEAMAQSLRCEVPEDGFALILQSNDPFDFVVEIEVTRCITYASFSGEVVCVHVGETRDVSAAMREYDANIAAVAIEERETADHRLGNKLRVMHLLAQAGEFQELNRQFERVNLEIGIRRGVLPLRRRDDDDDDSSVPRSQKKRKSIQDDENDEEDRQEEELFAIDARQFFADEFVAVRVTLKRPNGKPLPPNATLAFRDLRGRPLSPVVLQVLVLQDLASNATKYGTGHVIVEVADDSLTFTNAVAGGSDDDLLAGDDVAAAGDDDAKRSQRRRDNKDHAAAADASAAAFVKSRATRKVGLRALRQVCANLDLDIAFKTTTPTPTRQSHENNTEENLQQHQHDATKPAFVATLRIDVTVGSPATNDPSASDASSPDSTTDAKRRKLLPPLEDTTSASSDCAAAAATADGSQQGVVKASDLTWLLVDDEPLVGVLFRRLAKKHFDVDVRVLQRPSEVAGLLFALVDAAHKPGKPVVCILDEMLAEMNPRDFSLAPVTGTTLRTRLFECRHTRHLLDTSRLYLVSSSASDVADDRSLLKLGKTGDVKSDVHRIIRAVQRDDRAWLSRTEPQPALTTSGGT